MNFGQTILTWYYQNKRSMPWRETKDPYKIWVSEIILQQTRVNQGMPYYFRFLEKFPDVLSLADASEEAVLLVWKGLGYYSRARHMHQTANLIKNYFNGCFPKDYNTLINLKGIGPYTAAAIASVCNNEKRAAIDGNVIRVYSRYFGIVDLPGSLSFKQNINLITDQYFPEDNPGDYNQALMEYGALVCTPLKPSCSICNLKNTCFAFKNNLQSELPSKKKTPIKKIRYFNYFHIITPSGIILKKRTENNIWKNLWDFPLLEADILLEAENISEIINKNTKHDLSDGLLSILKTDVVFCDYKDVTHVLSHQILKVRFLTYSLERTPDPGFSGFEIVNMDDINYPVPQLIENFLKKV
ncbi:MAG: A/G-specific adenine glycosylase [Omnitrophica WOR_2 bacterium]